MATTSAETMEEALGGQFVDQQVDTSERNTVDNGLVKRKFDPSTRLIKVKGGQLYLQVRDRLIWLREEHPDAQIETYLVNYYADKEIWVVRAEISYWHENGQMAKGSGHGQESEKDFPAGALEKAETKAIGRALASLGYGTQFALEIDEGERIVDSPVEKKQQAPLTPAGVEELRESVIQMLEQDSEAKQKLQKGAGEMTEVELSKTMNWLRLRAARNQ